MPLVYAAFVPHSPVLLSTIGKEHARAYPATQESYLMIRNNLAISRADALIIVSPHGERRPFIQALISEHFVMDLKQFGDLKFTDTIKSSYLFFAQLKKRVKKNALTLLTEHRLDYGISVPLALLKNEAYPLPPVCPLRTSSENELIHYQFGSTLYEEIVSSEKAYALIASGDLAHLHLDSRRSEASKSFDHAVIQAIKNKDTETLTNPTGDLLADTVLSCALKPLAILLGSLGSLNYTPQILSYEHSLGVGELAAEFLLA